MFTSCCPAWVKYCENCDPELLDHISTCKSPMQMFSPVIKALYAEKEADDPRETVVVAIMPCTAKKMEAARDEFKTNGVPDTNYVLTTTELIQMITETGIDFDTLEDFAPCMPLGLGSGAGVIFGTTGGVAEAVIRFATDEKKYETLGKIEMSGVRGFDDVKEATIMVGETEIKIAVVHGLKDAQRLIKKIRSGECFYHLIEVMSCKGGCVGGAGQPIATTAQKKVRAKGLYTADNLTGIKRSEENPMIDYLYDNLVKDKAHEWFHVHYKH